MFRNPKWFVVLGVVALAFGLLFGTAMADPGDGGDGYGRHMHEQMDPELYAQMIQRMTEIHGAEFTADMLQRMNEGEHCHGAGQGMMGAGFDGAVMMNGEYGRGGMMDRNFDDDAGAFRRGVQHMTGWLGNRGVMNGGMMAR